MKVSITAVLFAVSLLLPACVSLTIENVEFGWPVESVLTVSDRNTVEERRYSISFSVAPVAGEEFQDSTALAGKNVRLLRSGEGFYYLTGAGFKHVYVFAPAPRELRLKNSIEVSTTGLKEPALNQRPPYVELVDGKMKKQLSSDDVVEGKDQ